MLRFFIKCNPPRSTAQASKRVGVKKDGKPFSYTDKKGKELEANFTALLMPHVPKEPMEGPVRLIIEYRLPFLKSEKKAVKKRGWAYHWKKPDLDNLLKLFQDTMGRLNFWNDDAQVVELEMTKVRHKDSGINVIMFGVDEET
jgi:Holliday junction resolvase RusA-like endonuclease